MRVRPWLWLSPSLAHKLSPPLLNGLHLFTPNQKPPEWRPLDWRGLHFPNRLGVAGGVDKDARNVKAWWSLGAGFIEVGTITPQPQPGNTAPVVGRDISHLALWNRLGFPSQGVTRVKKRLERLPRPFQTPVFANIGKNALTPLDQAHEDYISLLQSLRGTVDGFVINISSPNTKGLRELLRPERLTDFLSPILQARPGDAPVLLKLSPDMNDEELERVLEISHALNIDGWILTNTSASIRDGLNFPKEGGVSGKPLNERSRQVLRNTLQVLGERRKGKLVVSVGGILSADDVTERLELGADLVQVYSALIFEGPRFFLKVAKCQRPSRNN
jgi:dihydroorotate dehydrogenase